MELDDLTKELASILGFGATLALLDNEQEIGRIAAGAVASVLRLPFGSVIFDCPDPEEPQVIGQLRTLPLSRTLAAEMSRLVTQQPRLLTSNQECGEVEVQEGLLPEAMTVGLERLLWVRLMTVDRLLGLLIAGAASPEPFSTAQTDALRMLASQTSLALDRALLSRERAASMAALRETEERLAGILESAMDAIVTLEMDRRVTLFNNAAERVFRCPASQVLGQPFDRFVSPGLRHLLEDWMRAFSGSGEAKRSLWAPAGILARRFDGQEFPVEATLSRTSVAGKSLVTIILRDVNERHNAKLELQKLQNEIVYLQEEIRAEHNFGEIVGNSPALLAVLREVEQIAPTDSTVLIFGETGTGKELIARAIHDRSHRKGRPLVKVNCSAISAGLVESELFGHVKGAFTGAIDRHVGRFELADGGTIFLDEVGELPLETQVKLLRVLQEQEFEPVGSSRTVRVNVRIIAATNRDLEEAVHTGRFRSDLFYRLNVFPLCMPPLRDRPSDISSLVAFFLERFAKKFGKTIDGVSQATMRALVDYAWPGNIRELQNVIERGAVLCQGPVLALELEPSLLPIEPSPRLDAMGDSASHEASGPNLHAGRVPAGGASLEDVERQHVLTVLKQTGGVIEGPNGAARILNLHPNTLRSRMKKLGVPTKRSEPRNIVVSTA